MTNSYAFKYIYIDHQSCASDTIRSRRENFDHVVGTIVWVVVSIDSLVKTIMVVIAACSIIPAAIFTAIRADLLID
jgi:hypothetical protein